MSKMNMRKAYGEALLELGRANEKVVALEAARSCKGRPTAIIADTVKGKGFAFAEGKAAYHNAAMNDAEYALALEAVKKMKEEA